MATSSIRAHFLEDHARLEARLDALGNAAEGSLEDELVRVYRSFEEELRSHMEVEESVLFPLVEAGIRAELLAEHEAIREQLDELGLAVELHAVRKTQIDALIARLKEHAAREDVVLYRVADRADKPPRGLLDGVLARLGVR